MSIGGVVINFAAKTADAVGDIKKLTRGLGNVDDAAGDVTKSSGKMGKILGGAGLAAGAVAGAVVGLGAALWDAGQGAWEEEQAYRTLAKTLGKIPGVTEDAIAKNRDWIGSMQLATGVAEDELTVAIGKAALATGDLTQAQELVALAIDAGVATGKDWGPIADAMAKAVNGNTTALQKQFPWLEAGADGVLTYAEAVEQMTEKFDGASKAAEDNAPFHRLGIIFGELKDAVGTALVPLIDKFGKWMSDPKNQKRINDITQAVTDMATAMGEKAVDAIKDLMAWLSKPENQQALKDWATGMRDFASSIGSVVGNIKDVLYWINKLPSNVILRELGLLPDFGGGGGSSTSWSAPAPAPAARAGNTIGTLVYYGSGDLTRDAKKLKRLLEAEDISQGRTPGQRLAVAW